MFEPGVVAAHASWVFVAACMLAVFSYTHWRRSASVGGDFPSGPPLARLVAGLELPLLALISPALLFPTPRRLLVLTLVPIVWIAAWLAGGRAIPRTPLNSALFVLLAMVGVSLFATFDVIWSLGKVSGVVLGVLFFWAIPRWLITPYRLAIATALFIGAGGALSVLALVGTRQFFKFEGLPMEFPMLIRGLPGAEEGFNPNAVAGSLVLFVPLQVALLATAQGRRWIEPLKWPPPAAMAAVQTALLVLTAGTLLLMQSRAAWIGVIVAATVVAAWRSRALRVVAIVGAVAVVFALARIDTQVAASRALTPSGNSLDYAIAVRQELWSKAVEGIREHPAIGMGMNAFRKLKPVRFPIKYPAYIAIPDEPLPHAHNNLLQTALDLGLPGLVAYSSIWLLTATLLVQVVRRADATARSAAAGLGAGLIAHFIFGMTDAIPLGAKVGILFWFTLALAVGLHRITLHRWREAA